MDTVLARLRALPRHAASSNRALEDTLNQPSRRAPVPVYFERDVVCSADASNGRGRDARGAFVPGVESLGLLAESHRVIVVTQSPLPGGEAASELETAAGHPSPFPAGSWLITADPGVCAGERPAGVRTILVGPKRPPARRPTAHCDIEARDLSAAVMEILVRDTMS